MSEPKKWTKADVKLLCGALTTFMLVNRPPSGPTPPELEAAIRKRIDTAREAIVLSHLRSARETSAERYRENCETIGNELARFTKYGEPSELIERFIGHAKEEDAAHKKLEALVLRVHNEGLPPEVVAFDPFNTERGT